MALPFEIANFNLLNFANAYSDYFSGSAKDIEVKVKNENGNIVTRKIPNVAKFQKTIYDAFQNGLKDFNRKIYVHPDGDDSNYGDSAHPVKTFRGAISKIPSIGGIYSIHIKGSGDDDNPYVYNWTHREMGGSIYNAFVGIVIEDNAIVNFKGVGNHGDKELSIGSINLTNSFVDIQIYSKGKLVLKSAENKWHYQGRAGLFHLTNAGIKIGRWKGGLIEFEDNSYILAKQTIRDYRASGSAIMMRYQNFKFDMSGDNKPYFVELYSNSSTLDFSFSSCSLKDQNNEDVDVKTLIKGVVKDENGVPRNITSNVIF